MFAVGGRPLVTLYGVTAPKKFMPMTDKLTIVRAQDCGGPEMRHIPLDAIEEAREQASEPTLRPERGCSGGGLFRIPVAVLGRRIMSHHP